MKRILIILLACINISAYAQDIQQDSTKKAQITKIKRAQDQYIFADETRSSLALALEHAKQILEREVSAYIAHKGTEINDQEVISGIILDNMVQITITRGDKFRAFVYVNKDDLESLDTEAILRNSKETVDETSSFSEIVYESMNLETPEEEPETVQISTKPENVAEEDVAEVEETKSEVADADEDVITELIEIFENKTETQIDIQLTKSEVITEHSNDITHTTPQEENLNVITVTENDVVEILFEMSKYTTKNKLYDYILDLQKDQFDITFNPQVSPSDESYYLVMYRRNGTIAAILAPGKDIRKNILSGDMCQITKYAGCAVCGFKFNEK